VLDEPEPHRGASIVPVAVRWCSRPAARQEGGLGGLGQAHIDRLESLGALLQVELDRLTLFE